MTGSLPHNRATLGRPRLERRLEPDALPRLTALTAGPGFGKTTLLSKCFDTQPAVWHTMTAADRSLSLLARSIVRKLRLVTPRLSQDLVAAVEGARGPESIGDSGRPVAIAAALAEDLDRLLGRDVILVLDDVHEIQGADDSVAFLAALCRYGPRRLRIVTASRSLLPFPVSRLAVAGEVQEVPATDLAFSATEIGELVDLWGMEVSPSADEILALTGGWPAAVMLAIQAGGSDGATLGSTIAEKTPLFDYLAEEALATEAPADIDVLRDASLLPWVTKALLEHLGVDTTIEGSIIDPGAPWMTTALDVPHGVAVSPLVEEFLAERHPVDPDHARRVLVASGEWYLSEGAFAEALQCLMRSGDPSALAGALTAHGDSMIAAGITKQIVEAIGSLGDDVMTPELLLMEAEVRQLLGDWEGAMTRYRVLVPDEGEIPARLAWRLGFLYHMRGDVAAALGTYERGMLGSDDLVAEAALLGWRASAHWLRGERDAALELAEDALERARESADPRALATAHTVLAMVAALDGDRALNDMHYLKALEHAERGHDVVQTIRIRSNRGSHFLEEGAFDAALGELDIALRLADMTGFELWRAMALGNRGQVNLHRGLLEEALADLSAARATFRRIGSRLEAYPLATIADIHALRGDTAQARAMYREAIGLAEDQADLQALIPAQAGLAKLIAPREPEEAIEVAAHATKADFVIGKAEALIAAGWAHLHAGDHSRARDLAVEASEAARTRHDLPALAESLELQAALADGTVAAELLDDARSIWDDLRVPIPRLRVDVARAELIGGRDGELLARSAASELGRYGVKGLSMRARRVADAMAAGSGLQVKTLGGFDVVIDGDAVSPSAWQSRVAREILWMLIAARLRPINREVLIERLWPDEDPAKASNRLSVALTTIRKVFDPHKKHEPDHYLLSDREVVALDAANVKVDVEEFLEEARRGRALLREGRSDEAAAVLNAAEERYVGEFLEEQPYAEWAVGLREEARSEYLSVASSLAELAEKAGDLDLAARRYLRMLERDAYNEPVHLALVRVMEAAGRHGTARRLYGNYVARMAELDVEPEPFPASVTVDTSR